VGGVSAAGRAALAAAGRAPGGRARPLRRGRAAVRWRDRSRGLPSALAAVRPVRRPAAIGAAVAAALLAALLFPRSAAAQLRRDPVVREAAGARAGELLLGLGAGWEPGSRFPLSGLRGDLLRLGTLTAAYAVADGVVLEVRGDALRVLEIDGRGPSHVPLEPGVEDGRTADAGDFRIATVARLLGGARGPSAGVDVAVKLPNSRESRGIGLNTTDFEGSVFGSWGSPRLRATAELGIGILAAPLRTFVQDDVLLYGAEVVWSSGGVAGSGAWSGGGSGASARDRGPDRAGRSGGSLRVSLGASGRLNTRSVVPVGLEDRGRVRAGLEWGRGSWALDGSVAAGYGPLGPDLALGLGLARRFGP